jgi:uncharacterized OB-fold protein
VTSVSESLPYLPEVLGRPVPVASGGDAPYFDALLEHRLVVPRCSACRTWQWPSEVLCHKCHSFEMAWEEVAPSGTIFSWTRVWHPAREGLESAVPYVALVVALDSAPGVRLVGNLLGERTQPVAIGEAVEGVFEDHAGSHRYTLLQWQKRDDG